MLKTLTIKDQDYSMRAMWGKDLFGDDFNPTIQSIQTGTLMKSNTHHGGVCNPLMTRNCFKKFHYQCCTEWILCNGESTRYDAQIRQPLHREGGGYQGKRQADQDNFPERKSLST
ncbi:hypothetical protein K504DRAFT_498345 [Pleomassaria siparia CBS 279.74]|uniref:Uncharacterized protein n=1 Tax=Pleomassaria siparia CBS 279.74 TaxID=1314801 RepID=A0A6G1KKW1_9PLEO|nr:hypothetical protein K504DRAFT_498345 [Pleomassaria siparia CBS 279.74]